MKGVVSPRFRSSQAFDRGRAVTIAALAAPAPGAAITCSYGPDEYDAGGAPRQAFPNDPLSVKQWGLDLIDATAR
jgi:hypothetical protein